jgi:tetratricopeptide (TPR) repeat protein
VKSISSSFDANLRARAQRARHAVAARQAGQGVRVAPAAQIERPSPLGPRAALRRAQEISQDFAEDQTPGHASLTATVRNGARSSLEGLHTPVLIAVAKHLTTTEIVPLAATSHAFQHKLKVEIADRRCRELLPSWEAKVRARIEDVTRLAGAAKARHDLIPLVGGLFELGHHAKAMHAIRLLDWGGNNANNPLELGHILLSANRPEAAMKAVETLLGQEPCDEYGAENEARLIIAKANLLLGRPQDARAVLRPARCADLASLAMVQAMVAHALGESPQPALDIASTAFASAPHLVSQRSRMAEVYAWIGDAGKALSWMEKATESAHDAHLARVPFSPFARGIWDDPHWKPLRLRAEQIHGTTDIGLPKIGRRG